MKKITNTIISILLFVLALQGYAAESEALEQDVIRSDGKETDGLTVDAKKKDGSGSIEELEKATGSGLRKKKLSKAFERFIPSEKISADNAVPFPVDI
jgi:hypothetical protein